MNKNINNVKFLKGRNMLKILGLFSVIIMITTDICSQSLSDLSFGSDNAIEIMTWNIEWFPKNGQSTVDSVSVILQALDIDIYALQEISDTTMFKQMVNDIEEYDYYFLSSWFGGLAYVYKTDVIEINDIYEIYTEEPYWRPFPRSPMVMDLSYLGQDFYIINNHFKAFGDGYLDYDDPWDEETRRYDASNLLKEYIDTNLPFENVIVLGDLNDILTDEQPNNVFQNILDDDENYLFADIDIANGPSSSWSYPNWPSHIDHILITNELIDDFSNQESNIQTMKISDYMAGGFYGYDQYISDHYPVALKLENNTEIDKDFLNFSQIESLVYPNPFNLRTAIKFSIQNHSEVELSIYNLKGQKIKTLAQKEFSEGTHSVIWNGNDESSKSVSSGIYYYKLSVNGKTEAIKKCLFLK